MATSSISTPFSIPSLPPAAFTSTGMRAAAGLTPPLSTPGAAAALAASAATGTSAASQRALKTSQDFEAVFLNTMFSQMSTGVGNGPYSGGQAAGVWRSFLTDEYAKSFAKAGGIGIAAEVQRALLAQQEAR